MEGPGELKYTRHLRPKRITCVTCDTPICPDCAIRTEVGFKCPDHAGMAPAPRRSRGRGFPVAAWDGQGMFLWGGLVVVSSPASASEGVRYTP